MRQIWISKAGPPETLQLQEAPDPLVRSGEVRVRVDAVGINFADIVGRLGIYPDAPAIPYVPGYEFAGTVDQLGQGVPDLREGDRVFGLTRFGGYSDMICVPYKQIFKRFDWMSVQDGAAIPISYLTAFAALIVMGSVRAGDKVLIHGAGGGLGLAALDLCKIVGAETYGTASPDKHQVLLERGLDHAIDYRNQDYEIVMNDLTAGSGAQLILDTLGGIHWRKNYRLLRPTGRLIYLGTTTVVQGKKRSLLRIAQTLSQLPFYSPLKLLNDSKAVIGLNMGHLWNEMDLQRHWMQDILGWYDDVRFRPRIDRTFSFTEAAQAHHYIQNRANIGKVLLIP